jgi:hypothetical protein
VEEMWNYIRNEWRRCETTLVSSVFFDLSTKKAFPLSSASATTTLLARRDVPLARMAKKKAENTLETSGEDWKLHSKRVEKNWKYTRNESKRPKITLETSGKDPALKPWLFWTSRVLPRPAYSWGRLRWC